VQFSLTADQALLKDAVERFVRNRYASRERRGYRESPTGYDSRNWRELAEIGVLALPFAAADGGLSGGPTELITAMEALGAGLVVEPVLEEIVVAGSLLADAGSKEQKAHWLPGVVAGEAHLALAHFEHGARFNLSDVRVNAQTRAGTTVLSGEKTVVPLAAAADMWIVSARERGAPTDSEGIGLYLVSPEAAGIERRDFRMVDGSIASSIRLREVTAADRLRGGYAELAQVIDGARLAACGEMLGIMSTLLRTTLEYLRSRQQFGAPLASFQTLQHRMADLYVLLEQSRSHVYRGAHCARTGVGRERSIAGMKSYVSRAAVELGEECVHLHGGIGTTDELAIGHGYKRLILLANLFGDANSELVRFNRLRNAAQGALDPTNR